MNAPAADTTNKQDTPERALWLRRRDALLLELRALEAYLGIKPRERVMCPSCGRERNKERGNEAA